MKRSDMLLIIKNHLILEFLTCSEVTRDKCNDAADRVLDILQEEGMSPPLIPNPNWQGGWNSHTHPAYVNEWEPEDGVG